MLHNINEPYSNKGAAVLGGALGTVAGGVLAHLTGFDTPSILLLPASALGGLGGAALVYGFKEVIDEIVRYRAGERERRAGEKNYAGDRSWWKPAEFNGA